MWYGHVFFIQIFSSCRENMCFPNVSLLVYSTKSCVRCHFKTCMFCIRKLKNTALCKSSFIKSPFFPPSHQRSTLKHLVIVYKFPRYSMKCRGKPDTTWNIPHSITFSPLHFMLYRRKSISFWTVYSILLQKFFHNIGDHWLHV